MVDEKQKGTFYRFKTLPLRGIEYSLSKLIGIVLTVFLQMIAVMVISTLIYHFNWSNAGLMLLITLFYAIAIGCISLLAGFTAPNQTLLSGISIPVFYLMSFLDAMTLLMRFIPNGQALNGFLAVCQGGRLQDVSDTLLYLGAISVVFLCAAIYIYSKKGLNGHDF